MAAEASGILTVAIVHPPGYVGANPTIESMISFLAERGDDVHLISLERPDAEGAGFTEHALRAGSWFATRWGRPVSRLWMPVFAWREVRRVRANVVVAVDIPGALGAAMTLAVARLGHVYVSLHMESFADCIRRRRFGAALRAIVARPIVGGMDAVITQDDHRRRQLEEEHGLRRERVRWFLVPNSHRGRARRYESTYYQEKLGLRADEPLVLVAGSVQAAWSHTEFLIECAAKQDPPFYTLVLQPRDLLDDLEFQKLSAICHSRALLMTSPVPAAERDRAFGSATVGAAIYTSEFYWNQKFVGGASGKMMSYLQAGLPVIMHDSPGVTEVIQEYGCGEVLSGLDCREFHELVRRIASAPERYSANAERCYNERYEFDQAFQPVRDFMSAR
jgi:glycosyltransferase involved in cell wall biosynthesis